MDTTHSFSSVMTLIGNKYTFKRMSIGTKIMSESIALYGEALNVLKIHKFLFYTHEVKDSKNFKMVLFGLPKLDTKTINEEFRNSHNIQPVSVKEIETKRSNPDDALYLIEFDRQHISKREVMKIKYFYSISVYWRKPHKGNRGPTQCTKCSMFGHGARNCKRVSVCPACAGNHDYSVCTLNKISHDGSVIYKCYNCAMKNLRNVNHRADDPRCPCRQDYLEIRKRITTKNRNYHGKINFAGYESDDDDFPQLSNKEHVNKTYDHRSHTQKLYSDIAKSNNDNNRNDDISNERLLEIFFDAIDALQRCQNKFDKLRVLGMILKNAI